jgi:hypothetical protein
MKSFDFPQLIIVTNGKCFVRFPKLSLFPPHNFVYNWHKSLPEHAILKFFSTIFCAGNNKARSWEREILQIYMYVCTWACIRRHLASSTADDKKCQREYPQVEEFLSSYDQPIFFKFDVYSLVWRNLFITQGKIDMTRGTYGPVHWLLQGYHACLCL